MESAILKEYDRYISKTDKGRNATDHPGAGGDHHGPEFFSNLLLGTNYELKNRYIHVDFVDETVFQSAKKMPKCQIGTLDCTLEELAVLDLIKKKPSVNKPNLQNKQESPSEA